MAESLEAKRLDAFSYQQNADGSTVISGADGKPLPAGLYAFDLGGAPIILRIETTQAVTQHPAVSTQWQGTVHGRRQAASERVAAL
jgi:hypothetical protein